MRRIWTAAAIAILVANGTGCDIVKETIEQTITEQSVRLGDDLEELARTNANKVREGAMSQAFGGGDEEGGEKTGDAAASKGAAPAKKPNEENFDEFN